MRVPFNHNIDEQLVKEYEVIFSDLPGDKCEIIEAALRAFKSLPENFQYRILSGNVGKRRHCLDILSQIDRYFAEKDADDIVSSAEADTAKKKRKHRRHPSKSG